MKKQMERERKSDMLLFLCYIYKSLPAWCYALSWRPHSSNNHLKRYIDRLYSRLKVQIRTCSKKIFKVNK